jgi:hypothetical protein
MKYISEKKMILRKITAIVTLFLLLFSCKTVKEDNTEEFKDFLKKRGVYYKNTVYSSYYEEYFYKMRHKVCYDSTFLKYNKIYIEEERYPMLSLYIFHPSGKIFTSYVRLDSDKLSKPDDEGFTYTKKEIKIHLEGGGFFKIEGNKLIFQVHFFNLGGNLPFGRYHNPTIYTDIIFGDIENDTILCYKMYRARQLSFKKKFFEKTIKSLKKIYLEEKLSPRLREDYANKKVYYIIPKGTKIELFGYKKL